MQWNYEQPVAIRFGEGRVSEIGEIAGSLGVGDGVVVADRFFDEGGVTDAMIAGSDGALVASFSDFSPNPDVTEVDACAALLRRVHAGFVVALGGGSAMDVAKAAASICLTDEPIAAYHGTGRTMPTEHLPIIAVPTTAGTGSEVTCVAVLSDRAQGKKAPIVSDGFFPTCAIVDPEMTYSVPPHTTASTGMDVLSQAIEGYWSKGHQPICDACAVHAARLVFEYLPRAVADGRNDHEARSKMCEASVIAGLAFTLPKTTSSHACSFPLTNLLGIPHGEACGLTLDWFTRINADAQGGRVQRFASLLGFADADAMADAIAELKRTIGLRTGLRDLALNDRQIADLVRISRHPNLYNNPVDVTDEMLETMYRHLARAD